MTFAQRHKGREGHLPPSRGRAVQAAPFPSVHSTDRPCVSSVCRARGVALVPGAARSPVLNNRCGGLSQA